MGVTHSGHREPGLIGKWVAPATPSRYYELMGATFRALAYYFIAFGVTLLLGLHDDIAQSTAGEAALYGVIIGLFSYMCLVTVGWTVRHRLGIGQSE